MSKLSDMWYWSSGNELGQNQGHREDHEGTDYGKTKKAPCQARSALQREGSLRRHLLLVNLTNGLRVVRRRWRSLEPTKWAVAYTFAPRKPVGQHHHLPFRARAMEDPRLSTLLKNSHLAGSE